MRSPRERRDLIAAFAALADGEAAVLATVVAVEGSTYRSAGARALLLPSGAQVGLIGGGCLEGDLALRAGEVAATGRAMRVRYDHRGEGDRTFGLGLGCAGQVDVLLQRVSSGEPGPLADLRRAFAGGSAVATALVVDREGEGAPPLGACVALTLEERADLAEHGGARVRRRASHASWVELLEEIVEPPPTLLVCGAGADAIPVVRIADALGFAVHVLDPRPALACPERFPGAADVACFPAEEAPARVAVTPYCVAVVMTHHYGHDLAYLRWLLASSARYVGLLGPRRRAEELLRDLRAQGAAIPADALERLHAPAGLDLGADGPDEIALALVAEIQSALAGRTGGPLRERKGPIHDAPR